MEEVYFAFPADEKVNFDEVDYALNDQVIKDYSIDAAETKIIEASKQPVTKMKSSSFFLFVK